MLRRAIGSRRAGDANEILLLVSPADALGGVQSAEHASTHARVSTARPRCRQSKALAS